MWSQYVLRFVQDSMCQDALSMSFQAWHDPEVPFRYRLMYHVPGNICYQSVLTSGDLSF